MNTVVAHSYIATSRSQSKAILYGMRMGAFATVLALSQTSSLADHHKLEPTTKAVESSAFHMMGVKVGSITNQTNENMKLNEIAPAVGLALFRKGFRVSVGANQNSAIPSDFVVDVNITNVRRSHSGGVLGQFNGGHKTLTVNLDLILHTEDGDLVATASGKGESGATSFDINLQGGLGKIGDAVQKITQIPSKGSKQNSGGQESQDGGEGSDPQNENGQTQNDPESDSTSAKGMHFQKVQNTDINRAVFCAINDAMKRVDSSELVSCVKSHASFYVAASTGRTVSLAGGTNRGLKVGQELVLHRVTRILKDEDGIVIGKQTEVCGKIRITLVRGKYSEAVLLQGKVPVQGKGSLKCEARFE